MKSLIIISFIFFFFDETQSKEQILLCEETSNSTDSNLSPRFSKIINYQKKH